MQAIRKLAHRPRLLFFVEEELISAEAPGREATARSSGSKGGSLPEGMRPLWQAPGAAWRRILQVSRPNRQWLLASHPEGMPDLSHWRLVESPIRAPGPGQLLIRALYLSVDPYMRGRISPRPNYAKGVEVGEVMIGGGVGEVLDSRHPEFSPGDIVESFGLGWQEFPVIDGASTRKVDRSLGPIHTALSYLGLPGLTAYFGLLQLGRPKPGESVVISAASGAVGQVAGQIAKLMDCRAVAIAGSEEKLRWCRELGYDVCINRRTAPDLNAAIAAACPGGVDVFFDNTTGPIHDAVMANLAVHARIIVCGTVALSARFEQPDIGPRYLRQILVTRARVEGFLLFDFAERYDEGRRQLAEWARAGKLRHREDFLDGIEQMPRAFLRLLHGDNFGKQLVRLTAAHEWEHPTLPPSEPEPDHSPKQNLNPLLQPSERSRKGRTPPLPKRQERRSRTGLSC